jgi:hypothetical protein
MTQHPDDESPDRPPRLRWRCTICNQLLVLRPSTEIEGTFMARIATHVRTGNVCRAKMRIRQLQAAGLVPLRTHDGGSFVMGYQPLKEAGLSASHLTHIVNDYVRPTPWAPRWAVQYEEYLRRKRNLSLIARVAELAEAAADPERIQAFLGLLTEKIVDPVNSP